MMVKNQPEADLIGVGDECIHDLKPREPGEISVLGEVDAVGGARRVEELIAVGQADRVEAERLHLIHHLAIAAYYMSYSNYYK